MSDTGDDGDLSEREEKARYDAGLDANYQAMREQADDEAADRARRERTARTATPDDPTITSRPGPTPHLPPRPKPRARTFGPPGLRPVGPDADITITQPPAAPAAREQASGRLVGPPGLIADTVVAHWLEDRKSVV